MTVAKESRAVNYRELMRQVEQLAESIETSAELGSSVQAVAEAILDRFREQLGLSGARLYHREGRAYVLQASIGTTRPGPIGFSIPATYAPIEAALENGTVFMGTNDPRIDLGIEEMLGVQQFAAVEVGDEDYILAFDVPPGTPGEDVVFSLGILRQVINQRIRRERFEDIFRQARRIQASILPRRVPTYGNYDLAGRSEAMDSVGGDFYDYIPLTEKILGLAIADVSGHGLPAALQVRDIYMGLRMGLGRDFKIVRTVERLNNIIHRSTLTSRFVSMFYGELELNGVFIYVNAGHPPPFHLAADGTVRMLEEGGAVLGPLADATYERGFVRLQPGDMLVLYTDGIVETTRSTAGGREEYGVERLIEAARAHRGKSAADVIAALFAEVETFGGHAPPADDRTLVVVRYPEVAPA